MGEAECYSPRGNREESTWIREYCESQALLMEISF